jgi:hypothetical protein
MSIAPVEKETAQAAPQDANRPARPDPIIEARKPNRQGHLPGRRPGQLRLFDRQRAAVNAALAVINGNAVSPARLGLIQGLVRRGDQCFVRQRRAELKPAFTLYAPP